MFCTKCGSKLNENGVCLNCSNINFKNNTTKKTSVGKIYLKIVGFSFVLFFFSIIFKTVLRFCKVEISGTLNSILLNIQVTIPMLLIIFGIIPALIISSIKNK